MVYSISTLARDDLGVDSATQAEPGAHFCAIEAMHTILRCEAKTLHGRCGGTLGAFPGVWKCVEQLPRGKNVEGNRAAVVCSKCSTKWAIEQTRKQVA